MSVEKKQNAVVQMHADMQIIDDLLGGVKQMRSKGKTYLPKFPLENDRDYDARLKQATLKPVLKETIKDMVGRVFAKGLVKRDIPDFIDVEDIDAVGNKLEVFCADWFKSALSYGVSFVVVDYQRDEDVETMADVQEKGLKAHAIHVPLKSVLGWRSQIVGGNEVCTQFRYLETVSEDDGEFATTEATQIVVLEVGRKRTYRYDGDEYILREDVELSVSGGLFPCVPVVALYSEQAGFFTATPPLIDLAYMNVEHWQSKSDQQNILHVARVPLLARFGVVDDGDFQVGGSTIDMPEGSDMRFVEHSGKAIEAGAKAIEKLEQDMQIAGAKLLIKNNATYTDSQAKNEQKREVSALQQYAKNLEDAIGQMLYLFALWNGSEDGGTVSVSGNLSIDYNPETSMTMIRELHVDGIISNETRFREAQKREVISSDINWEEEQTKVLGSQ